MARRLLLALRAVLAGWAALLAFAYALEWLLRRSSDFTGAEWLATVRLALDCCILAAAGWVTGRLSRKRPVVAALIFAATLCVRDFNPLLPLDVPWLLHLAIDTIRDSRYAESLLATAVSQVFLLGSLIAGGLLARPRTGPTQLLSTRFVHPINMKLAIEGMHCDACVRRVQNAIVSVEGAKASQVEVGSAVVSIDPTGEELVLDAVRKAGYKPSKVE